MNTQRDINLTFIESKGFDVYDLKGLHAALKWLKTVDADSLLYGEPTGNEFDIMVGEMRRPMLICSVEAAIAAKCGN
ncbi:hypothetical protein [Ruminococcus flavefaciens]|uniref:hypothetical protein n=1 Tax=Ruminococcus flavefaciens TaxID=1265 RepID=UPI0026F15130|nr:hypothetical protein [Ruminococcus flavefaciens]